MDRTDIFKVVIVLVWFMIVCSAGVGAGDPSFSIVSGNWSCDRNENSLIHCEGDAQTEPANKKGNVSLTKNLGEGDNTNSSGYVFYKDRVRMMDPHSGEAASFSTNFTFRIGLKEGITGGDGLVFVMLADGSYRGDAGGSFGVYKGDRSANILSNQQGTTTFCVEFDTYQNLGVDFSGNHVGVNLQNTSSVIYKNATDMGIDLAGGYDITAWIDYNYSNTTFEVRIANASNSRPSAAWISYSLNLSTVVEEYMTVGLAASTGGQFEYHHLSTWSLETFGLRPVRPLSKGNTSLIVQVSAGAVAAVLLLVCCIVCGRWRLSKRKKSEIVLGEINDLENSEVGLAMYDVDMPLRFTYKQLSVATDGFSEDAKLGQGGSSSVYRGVIASTGTPVAVKRVSDTYKHGEKDFLAEISVVSRLRHRHLVKLLGWCAEGGNFLLVYELMPHGSLDKLLFEDDSEILSWPQRVSIVKGVAAGLAYLHEGFSQQVIHRDIKSSNVMLDQDFNALVGDFGLARLMEHTKKNQMTQLAGTMGYIAPEAAVSGEFSAKTDVYAYGALVLEVACAKPAYRMDMGGKTLLDWVWGFYEKEQIMDAVDKRLEGDFPNEEMEHMLLVGLLCSHPDPDYRPSMRNVELILAGHRPLPPIPLTKPTLHFTPIVDWIKLMTLNHSTSSFSRRSAFKSSTNTSGRSFSSYTPTGHSIASVSEKTLVDL